MLARRGLLGAFLAAPAIITIPGLLMRIKPQPHPGTYIDMLDHRTGLMRRFVARPAIDGNGRLVIMIPAGTYEVKDPVVLKAPMLLNGSGKGSTFLAGLDKIRTNARPFS